MVQSQSRIAPGIAEGMQVGRAEHLAAGLAASLRGAGTGAMRSLWEELSRIEVPTLFLAGEEDRKFQAIAAEMAQRIPNARSEAIPEAGHSAHLEAPEAFGSLFAKFLSLVDGERGPYTGLS